MNQSIKKIYCKCTNNQNQWINKSIQAIAMNEWMGQSTEQLITINELS